MHTNLVSDGGEHHTCYQHDPLCDRDPARDEKDQGRAREPPAPYPLDLVREREERVGEEDDCSERKKGGLAGPTTSART